MVSIIRPMAEPNAIAKALPRVREKEAVAAPAPAALPPASRMVEVQARSAVAAAAPMSAPTQLRLTLMQSGGAIHAGQEAGVRATAERAGFLYVYEREGDGPWTVLGGAQGLEMTPGRERLLPAIRIPEGVARVTLLAFLTAGSGSPPDPDRVVPGRAQAELVLDVVEK